MKRRARDDAQPKQAPRPERPCLMPNCRRTTRRPLGYCDRCWSPRTR